MPDSSLTGALAEVTEHVRRELAKTIVGQERRARICCC